MDPLTTAAATLSAMITPAILISACGQLTLTTSQRLARSIERTRAIARRFEVLAQTPSDPKLVEDERAMLFEQLALFTQRVPILQRVMTSLYIALCLFVASSVFIGVDTVWKIDVGWLAVLPAVAGVLLLLLASVFLIGESRIALSAVDREMHFVQRLGERLAPEYAQKRETARWRLRHRRTRAVRTGA